MRGAVVGGAFQNVERDEMIFLTLAVSLDRTPVAVRTLYGGAGLSRMMSRRRPTVADTQVVGLAAMRILHSSAALLGVSFCKTGVFHVFRSGSKNVVHSPRTDPRTRVLIGAPQERTKRVALDSGGKAVSVTAGHIQVSVSGRAKLFGVVGLVRGGMVARAATPMRFSNGRAGLSLGRDPRRCFCNNKMRGKQFSRGKGVVTVRGAGG